MMMAYAKGARTFERHIDIKTEDRPFAPYNSTPEQVAEWFRAFHKAKEMCGGSADERRRLPRKEIEYLDGLVRGVYARRDLPPGHALTDDDFYLAIPLQKGQLSSRELIAGDVLVNPIPKDAPITINAFDNPYSRPGLLHELIARRGVEGPAIKAPEGAGVAALNGEKKPASR